MGICPVVRPQKIWIDSVNDLLKKKSLNVSKGNRVVHDRNEWGGRGSEGECL